MSRTSTARANALRQARQAKAAREAERMAREQAIEAALADFFEQHGRAASLREEAARRADALVRDAETKAAAYEAAARAAVRALRALVESHAEVAELTGLSLGTVRGMLTSSVETGESGSAAAGERGGAR